MFELLTKSKIRKNIILLFVYNQRKEFYLSEIARMVNTSPGTAQRELNRLIAMDFVTFQKTANLNVYKLNLKHPLLGEIESIVQKTFGVEVELRAELLKIGQIRYAFLFGSYVKGGFKSDSDIDLFIIGDAENEQVFDAIQKVEEKIGREINYHVLSENEFKEKVRKNFFLQEIVKDFILLKGDESEFKRIVDEAAARGKILN